MMTWRQMIVHCLGSGSSGNAFVIESPGGGCLAIDCGVPVRKFKAMLETVGRDIAQIDGLCISHEHIDHVRALPSLQRHGVPVYATPGTQRALQIRHSATPLAHWQAIQIGAFEVMPLPVGHDAAEPCGFIVSHGAYSIAILSDLGSVGPKLLHALSECDLVVLEANHDEEMLWNGPYPLHLKHRVASATGHLSNRDCANFLQELSLCSNRLVEVWLAHLSAQNNKPEAALHAVRTALERGQREITVQVLPRFGPVVTWSSEESRRQLQLQVKH